MSIYFTPSQQLIDEETSNSEDSVYITPDMSFTDSVFDVCRTPRVDGKDVLKSYNVFEWNSKNMQFSSPCRREKIYHKKEYLSDSMYDKENIGCSSIKKYRRSSEGTPLKSITTCFEPHFKVNKSSEQNKITTKITQRGIFQRMGFYEKLKAKCKVVREKNISDISLDTDGEAIVIRIPKQGYGSLGCDNMDEQEKTETNSPQKSKHLIDRASSFSVFKKCRLSPLKRLFTRSVTSVCSCYRKYLSKSSKNQYESLNSLDVNGSHNPVDVSKYNTENLTEETKTGINCVQIKNIVSSTTNIEDLLRTVVSKLSSIENELKDLKSIAKEYKDVKSITNIPPPPPPLPPLPPPLPLGNIINHSSTPKRKVDLTTPENDQLAKRPSRVQERAQFSITVEDLRNVKLRKIGNSIAKKLKADTISNKEPVSLPASARIGSFRYKRNRTVNKELSEIAAELLSPRKNDTSKEAVLMSSPNTTNNTPIISDIYEQTPKMTERRSSMFRTVKRKELLSDSPVRKRLNSSGLSSLKSRNSISDVINTSE